MAVEVTVVLRFEQPPDEDALRGRLEEEHDCIVMQYEEEEI